MPRYYHRYEYYRCYNFVVGFFVFIVDTNGSCAAHFSCAVTRSHLFTGGPHTAMVRRCQRSGGAAKGTIDRRCKRSGGAAKGTVVRRCAVVRTWRRASGNGRRSRLRVSMTTRSRTILLRFTFRSFRAARDSPGIILSSPRSYIIQFWIFDEANYFLFFFISPCWYSDNAAVRVRTPTLNNQKLLKLTFFLSPPPSAFSKIIYLRLLK